MKQSIYQEQKNQRLKMKACKLYKEGFTLREVGNVVKRSHQWVADALKDQKKGQKSYPLDNT